MYTRFAYTRFAVVLHADSLFACGLWMTRDQFGPVRRGVFVDLVLFQTSTQEVHPGRQTGYLTGQGWKVMFLEFGVLS